MKVRYAGLDIYCHDSALPRGCLDAEKGLTREVIFDVSLPNPAIPEGTHIGRFTLAPMPGCCGVVVSTGTSIVREWQHCVSKQFHDAKASIAKDLGYTMMICTIQTSNFPSIIGTSGAGWKHGDVFRNKRTGNDIVISTKRIL